MENAENNVEWMLHTGQNGCSSIRYVCNEWKLEKSLDVICIQEREVLAQLGEILQQKQIIKIVYVVSVYHAEINDWYLSFVLHCMYTNKRITKY